MRLYGQHCFIDIQNAYRVFLGEALLLNSRFQDKLKLCRCPLTFGFFILSHLVSRLVNQLTYRQTCWNDVQCPTKTQEFTLHHNVQCRLGQSEDWIFWVSRLWALAVFDVTSFLLFCQASDVITSSVDTLIANPVLVRWADCCNKYVLASIQGTKSVNPTC